MTIKIQFHLIIVTITMIAELSRQTSQTRLNDFVKTNLNKDPTENISGSENYSSVNLKPLKKFSFNPTTSLQNQNNRQSAEKSSIHFPNSRPKLSPAIKLSSSSSINTNSTLRSSKTIKVASTTTPISLSRKLPKRTDGKVISNNKIGQPANFPVKVRSGQLSLKSAPENLSARRALTDTKLVSDQYAKFKKPVLQRIASPASKGKNFLVLSPKQSASKAQIFKLPSRKSIELAAPQFQSRFSIDLPKTSQSGRLPATMRANGKENRQSFPQMQVARFKNMMNLTRSQSH